MLSKQFCCLIKKEDLTHERVLHDGIFKHANKRSCTDVFALLLYIVSWIGLITLIIVAHSKGANHQKLIHGVDVNGQICGYSHNVTDKPYAAWMAMPLTKSDYIQCDDCYQIMQCVQDCRFTSSISTNHLLVDKYTSSASFLYFCIPSAINHFPYKEQFEQNSQYIARMFVDLYTTWPVILSASLLAIACSILYTLFVRRFATIMVIVSSVLMVVAGMLFGVQLIIYADNTTYANIFIRIMGILTIVMTVMFMIGLFMIRKHIKLTIKLVKESGRVIRHIPLVLMFPIIPMILGLAYTVLIVYAIILVCSVWDESLTNFPVYITSRDSFYDSQQRIHFSFNSSLLYMFIYILFHFFWTMQFLLYYIYMVIAGAVSNWYFNQTPTNLYKQEIKEEQHQEQENQLYDIELTPEVPQQKKSDSVEPKKCALSRTPIVDSATRTLLFHSGTILFTSSFIAIINCISSMLKIAHYSVSHTLKCLPKSCRETCLCCIVSILSCFKCCINKMNHQVLIWGAIHGDNFVKSMEYSYEVLSHKFTSVAVINTVVFYFITVGKLCVAICSTTISILVIQQLYDTKYTSLVIPAFIIFTLTLTVANAFMSVIETIIETLFFCFIVDEYFYAQQTGKMHAPERLQKMISKKMISND